MIASRLHAVFLSFLALAAGAGGVTGQENVSPDPGARLVVFEDFNRFT